MDLLNKEYVHIGTDKIYKELWQNVQMDQFYKNITKPYGGLWCSNKSLFVCDWLSYVYDDIQEHFSYVSNKPACLLKLKNNSKLLKLENNNDLLNLKQSNFIINLKKPISIDKFYYKYIVDFLPDYEKISKYYDLIYVNPFINNSFKEYSIPTMLILNPNSIQYYKSLKYNLVDKENAIITNIGKETTLDNPNKDFYLYKEYIKSLFTNINEKNYDEFIRILYNMKKSIINSKENLYNNLGFNINCDPNKLLEVVTENIYREKYLEKQKVLHK